MKYLTQFQFTENEIIFGCVAVVVIGFMWLTFFYWGEKKGGRHE